MNYHKKRIVYRRKRIFLCRSFQEQKPVQQQRPQMYAAVEILQLDVCQLQSYINTALLENPTLECGAAPGVSLLDDLSAGGHAAVGEDAEHMQPRFCRPGRRRLRRGPDDPSAVSGGAPVAGAGAAARRARRHPCARCRRLSAHRCLRARPGRACRCRRPDRSAPRPARRRRKDAFGMPLPAAASSSASPGWPARSRSTISSRLGITLLRPSPQASMFPLPPCRRPAGRSRAFRPTRARNSAARRTTAMSSPTCSCRKKTACSASPSTGPTRRSCPSAVSTAPSSARRTIRRRGSISSKKSRRRNGSSSCIRQREETLLRCCQEILKRQLPYFRSGQALAPMTMQDIAQAVGLHTSTVSRALSGKYIQTPQGVRLLRSLFSAKLAGGEVSGVMAQQAIAVLVQQEDKHAPAVRSGACRAAASRRASTSRAAPWQNTVSCCRFRPPQPAELNAPQQKIRARRPDRQSARHRAPGAPPPAARGPARTASGIRRACSRAGRSANPRSRCTAQRGFPS